MWVDLYRTSNPSVPLCRKRVEDLGSHYFGSGHSFFRSVLEVAVVKEELSDRPAGLKLISPEEQAHAIVFSCAKRLREADCNEEERKQWRLTLRLGFNFQRTANFFFGRHTLIINGVGNFFSVLYHHNILSPCQPQVGNSHLHGAVR